MATVVAAVALLAAGPVLASAHRADVPDATVTLSVPTQPSFRPGETIPFSVGCPGGEHMDAFVTLASADPPYSVVGGVGLDPFVYDGDLVIPVDTPAGPYTITAGCYSISGLSLTSDPVPIVVSGDPITTTTSTTTSTTSTTSTSTSTTTSSTVPTTTTSSSTTASTTSPPSPTAVPSSVPSTTAATTTATTATAVATVDPQAATPAVPVTASPSYTG